MDFRTEWTHVLATAIPSEAKPESVIKFLHDHEAMIKLSPLVTDFHQADSRDGLAVYTVHETVSILPMGLWSQPITFTASFQNREQGLWTKVEAPLGFVSEALYNVMLAKDVGADVEGDVQDTSDGTQWVMKETITSSSNMLLKAVVDANLVPTRRTMAKRLMERVCNGDSSTDTSS